MCFGGSSKAPETPTPAAAPAPPSLPAEQQRIGKRRRRENRAKFGKVDGPGTRREDSTNIGLNTGSSGSGSGIKL